jgi:2-hydroxychromene-2-carboxylate isomerase
LIEVTLFNDPGCPWAYSAVPALRVLEWRYGTGLRWRLVLIGLTERAEQYVARGYTPARSVQGQLMFRERYGMPFALMLKRRVSATARACRVVVAVRLAHPGREWEAFRAIQLANFNSDLVLEDEAGLRAVLEGVDGVDAAAVIAALDSAAVSAAYERDRAEARTAAGSPTEFQGKAAATDGPVRYTAPSLKFRRGELTLEAGGFQPVEAYDVLVANLDPTLERRPPPEGSLPLLQHFRTGLTTQEVAALLAVGNTPPDRDAAERELLALVGDGAAERRPLGDDALWLAR